MCPRTAPRRPRRPRHRRRSSLWPSSSNSPSCRVLRRVGFVPGVVTTARVGVLDVVHPCSGEAQVLCGALREIEVLPPNVGATVVHGYLHRAATVADSKVRPQAASCGPQCTRKGRRAPLAVGSPSNPGPYQEARPVSASARSFPSARKAPTRSTIQRTLESLSITHSPPVSFTSTCGSPLGLAERSIVTCRAGFKTFFAVIKQRWGSCGSGDIGACGHLAGTKKMLRNARSRVISRVARRTTCCAKMLDYEKTSTIFA